MPTLGRKAFIQIAPGVSPPTDITSLDSIYYVNADKVRFQHGKLRKLKGWQRLFSSNNIRIKGVARMVYTYTPLDGIERTLIGTSCNLYCYENGAFYNITPLQTSSTSIANSLATVYSTSSSYSINTVDNSNIVTFNIPHFLSVGDQVKISGVTGTIGGVSNTFFNTAFSVTGVSNNQSFQSTIATTASSTDTGGGSSITFATSQIIVTLANHGLVTGDRVSIEGATAVGGIANGAINIENTVSAVISTSQFIVNTSTIATSHVTAGGGAGAILYVQIPCGAEDQSYGYGYGGGYYGDGLYGIGKLFNSGFQRPRIWSCDRFGDNIILTPGGQNHVYIWENDVTAAPTILSNAPDAVDWVFESHGMVCVLCPDGNTNVMQSSNIGDATQWTPGPASTANIQTVPGCGRFISQASARDVDLLFTNNRVYLMEYISLPFIWRIKELMTTDGLIGPKARTNIEDAIFWMGNGDFFVFDGTSVNILPNNTVKRYVFDNINTTQAYKAFAASSPAFNEIWWFYPTGTNIEPGNYVIYNYKEQSWSIGTLERTAALDPANAISSIYMVQSRISATLILENNPLSTNFYTLGANPITTTNSSSTIQIQVGSHKMVPGDFITIAGATTTNGITAGNINGVQAVASITPTSIFVGTSGTATSSGTGGGSSITIGTQIITVNTTGSLSNSDSITLNVVSSFDNFGVGQLNGTFVVRAINTNSVDISVSGAYAGSQTSGGGNMAQLTFVRTGRLFQHEIGTDDYDDSCDLNNPTTCIKPLYSFAETNYAQLDDGNNNILVLSIIPDSTQIGTMSITVKTKQYPQSQFEQTKGPFIITEIIEKIDIMIVGRQRKYIISSNELGQDFTLGRWYEQVTETTPI